MTGPHDANLLRARVPGSSRGARLRAARPPIAAAILAGFVSFAGSWHVSLWKDETDSVSAATRSLSGLWHLVQHIDAVHATYYLTLHAWTSVIGRSAAALRLPSALAVALAAAGVYLLAARLAGKRVAGMATTVFIVLPRVTWMGIEARPFAYTATLGVWLTYLFVRACDRPSRARWIGYALLGGSAIAVNIYVGLLLVSHGLTLVLSRGNSPRHQTMSRLTAWSSAGLGAVLLASPVMLKAISQRGQLGDTSLGAAKLARSILVNQWFLGNTPADSGGGADSWRISSVALAAVCWTLIGTAVVAAVRRRTSTVAYPLAVLGPWIAVPTAVIGGYSLAISPVYSARYFCFCTPAIAVLTAIGLGHIARRALRWSTLALVVALTVPIYLSQRQVEGKGSDWSEVAAFVSSHRHAHEGVYFVPRYPPTGPTVGSTARYVEMAYPAAFLGLRDLTQLTSPAQDDSLTGTSRLLDASLSQVGELTAVWVIGRRDYPRGASDHDREMLVRAGFHPARTSTFTIDTITLFVRR